MTKDQRIRAVWHEHHGACDIQRDIPLRLPNSLPTDQVSWIGDGEMPQSVPEPGYFEYRLRPWFDSRSGETYLAVECDGVCVEPITAN